MNSNRPREGWQTRRPRQRLLTTLAEIAYGGIDGTFGPVNIAVAVAVLAFAGYKIVMLRRRG